MDAHDLMLARRSVRRYTAREITEEDERALIEAAFAAPSANNDRPWHFVFVRDKAVRARLAKVHEWAKMCAEAPLVIVVLGRADSTWWVEDCSAATENILLQATDLGLGSVWIGIRDESTEGYGDEKGVLEIVGATPDRWRCLCLVAVGHPAQHPEPRTQVQTSKLSFERFGRRARR